MKVLAFSKREICSSHISRVIFEFQKLRSWGKVCNGSNGKLPQIFVMQTSDVQIDLFHDSWFTRIFSKIRLNSTDLWWASKRDCTHDSQKRWAAQKVQLTIQLTYGSLCQIHTIQQKARFNSFMMRSISQVLLVISYLTLLGLLPKSHTFLIHDNAGTQTWEYSKSDFCECYTIDIEIQNKPAIASFIMSCWEFTCAPPWLKKDWL